MKSHPLFPVSPTENKGKGFPLYPLSPVLPRQGCSRDSRIYCSLFFWLTPAQSRDLINHLEITLIFLRPLWAWRGWFSTKLTQQINETLGIIFCIATKTGVLFSRGTLHKLIPMSRSAQPKRYLVLDISYYTSLSGASLWKSNLISIYASTLSRF